MVIGAFHQPNKKYFLNPTIINPNEINLSWNNMDKKKVLNFMCKKHGFDKVVLNKDQLESYIQIDPSETLTQTYFSRWVTTILFPSHWFCQRSGFCAGNAFVWLFF